MIDDMTAPKLSFLIATRDRREALLRLLDNIGAQTYPHKEVVVVDDGSTDGTADAIAERFPDVRLVANAESIGTGRAMGAGFEAASGDIIVNVDDDALFASTDAADRIVRYFAENPDVGVLCFRVEAPDGSIRHREIPLRSKRLPTEPTRIAYFLGGAVAFRREALQAAGGYPTKIGYASWENDVAFRLFRAGERILFTPDIRVVHYALPSMSNTTQREANYVLNEIRLAARYLPEPYASVHAALWIGQSTLQAAANGRLRGTMRAVGAGLASWRGIRKDRSARLTRQEARALSRLSGRTWY